MSSLTWYLGKWELNLQLKINLDQRLGKQCIDLSQKIRPSKVLLIGPWEMSGRLHKAFQDLKLMSDPASGEQAASGHGHSLPAPPGVQGGTSKVLKSLLEF